MICNHVREMETKNGVIINIIQGGPFKIWNLIWL